MGSPGHGLQLEHYARILSHCPGPTALALVVAVPCLARAIWADLRDEGLDMAVHARIPLPAGGPARRPKVIYRPSFSFAFELRHGAHTFILVVSADQVTLSGGGVAWEGALGDADSQLELAGALSFTRSLLCCYLVILGAGSSSHGTVDAGLLGQYRDALWRPVRAW
jgi:hypothetical protein